MTKQEFLALVERWSESWDREFAAGEPGFGTEDALDDWLGSIDAYVRIEMLSIGPTDVSGRRFDEGQRVEEDGGTRQPPGTHRIDQAGYRPGFSAIRPVLSLIIGRRS
jgi:hypothetical protein